MNRRKTLSSILAIISFVCVQQVVAQENNGSQKENIAKQPKVQGIQYASREDAAKAQIKASNHLFEGLSASIDLVGIAMQMMGDYGQYEGALKANLKNRFFPTVEMGYGTCDYTSEETELHYKTNAPYIRLGFDYNLIKKPASGNRILVGLRYAFTTFKYDINGPSQQDPIWGSSIPFDFKDLSGNCNWVEVLFGLEAKIYKAFHIGWSLRYKQRLSQKGNEVGQAWYVPGFGKNDKSCWTGSFNLVFDI
ncbi:MAG: DUF6048 family protein [Bacteroidaceae bacterium]